MLLKNDGSTKIRYILKFKVEEEDIFGQPIFVFTDETGKSISLGEKEESSLDSMLDKNQIVKNTNIGLYTNVDSSSQTAQAISKADPEAAKAAAEAAAAEAEAAPKAAPKTDSTVEKKETKDKPAEENNLDAALGAIDLLNGASPTDIGSSDAKINDETNIDNACDLE